MDVPTGLGKRGEESGIVGDGLMRAP